MTGRRFTTKDKILIVTYPETDIKIRSVPQAWHQSGHVLQVEEYMITPLPYLP